MPQGLFNVYSKSFQLTTPKTQALVAEIVMTVALTNNRKMWPFGYFRELGFTVNLMLENIGYKNQTIEFHFALL